MNRYLLLAIPLLLLSVAIDASAQEWLKVYGGAGEQLGYVVEPTDDGGFVVGGNTYGDSTTTGYWVVRCDSTGAKLWERSYNQGTGYTKLWALRPTRDHGMLLSGFSGIQYSGSESALLYKIDSAGGIVWQKVIDYPRADHAHFLVERKSYGYYMGGHTDSKEDASGMMWLVKFDDDRNMVWEKTYSLNYAEHAHAGQEAPDGGCIMAGHTEVNNLEKIWALRVDSNGTQLWSKTFSSGDEYQDSPYYVINTREGGFAIFGGSSHASKPFGTGWLIVTDANGNIVVDKHYGRATSDAFLWSGRQTSDGGYILAGYSNDQGHGDGDYDMYVVKTDAQGEIQWEKRFGDVGDDEAFSVIETADGYIVSGETYAPALMTGVAGNVADLLLVKISKEGASSGVVRIPHPAGPPASRAYPNPASSGEMTIEIAGDLEGGLQIFDRSGAKVRVLAEDPAAGGRFQWDLQDGSGLPVPAGVYYYRASRRESGMAVGSIVVTR